MAFLLDGKPLAVDVPFTHGDIQYPANWLRLSTAEEKAAIGITEVADAPVYDQRFYNSSGVAKALDGVKTKLKLAEKEIAKSLLSLHDWQVIRKTEKSVEIDSDIATFRDKVRTVYTTRKTEIENCSDIAALVTLYGLKEDGTPNMTQYPDDPDSSLP
jgi:hypothetical protein|tara:strand:- start:118 stop:591 length:474 start_codon:yes stop_codon:yes gene_type:complete